MPPRAQPGQPQKFLRAVAAHPPSGCVFWPYGKDRLGYGRVRMGTRQMPAHRAAWELHHGREMAEGMDACHEPTICHNRDCVNPLHIREGSRADNMADTAVDGTIARGVTNARAKLTESAVRAIRADPRSYRAIAEAFNVSFDTVRSIETRRRWGWLQ